MLVLSRSRDQIVDILFHGVKIAEVMLVDIRDGSKARLGFTAENDVLFLRRELIDHGPSPERRAAR